MMNIILTGHNPFLCHLSLGNTEVLSNRSFAASPFVWYKTAVLESKRDQRRQTKEINILNDVRPFVCLVPVCSLLCSITVLHHLND